MQTTVSVVHRYGFQGQEEDESPYACFANNPIWFIDPSGADSTLYDKGSGNFIAKGITKKDDKTAIYVVDVMSKGYDPRNPWKKAQKLRYTVGKNQVSKVGATNLRDEHPLAGKGWTYNAQVYEEDLLDMTKEFDKLLVAEKPYFKKVGAAMKKESDVVRLAKFASLVEPNGPYDLKSQTRNNLKKIPSYAAIFIGEYSFYDGRLMSNDDYGNFGYGYWGKAYGFDVNQLLKSANIAQMLDTGKPDPPRDQFMVALGYLKK